MNTIDCIKTRRSIRKFKNKEIPKEILLKILECGRWAPSGGNHQPWKVYIVQDKKIKSKLAQCTKFSEIIDNSAITLAIYLDKPNDYNYTKNVQSIGAFFQSILLGIHEKGLGGVWLGEIYNHKEEVDKVLEIPPNSNIEFMGAISMGYPAIISKSSRDKIDKFIVWK